MVGLAAAVAIPFGVIGAIFLAEYGSAGEQSSRQRVVKLSIWPLSVLAGTIGYFVSVRVVGSSYAGGLVPAAGRTSSCRASSGDVCRQTGFLNYRSFLGQSAQRLSLDPGGGFCLWWRGRAADRGLLAVAGGVATLSLLMLPNGDAHGRGCDSDGARTHAQGSSHTAWGATKYAGDLARRSFPRRCPGILTGVMLAVARAAGETRYLDFRRVFKQLLALERRKGNSFHRSCSSTAFSSGPFICHFDFSMNFSGMPYESI